MLLIVKIRILRRKLNSNNRAKQFITRVGLAGVYEVFKLGKAEEAFEVRTSAIGGAAQIGFEEFLDGRVDFAEVTRIVYEGMEELIAKEVAHALKASINQLPPANRVAANGFDESEFDRLIYIASAYGVPAIYCTYEFLFSTKALKMKLIVVKLLIQVIVGLFLLAPTASL